MNYQGLISIRYGVYGLANRFDFRLRSSGTQRLSKTWRSVFSCVVLTTICSVANTLAWTPVQAQQQSVTADKALVVAKLEGRASNPPIVSVRASSVQLAKITQLPITPVSKQSSLSTSHITAAQWAEVVKDITPLQAGCFEATFPLAKWHPVDCPYSTAVPKNLGAVPSAGIVTLAEGTLLDVSGVTAITDSMSSGKSVYSLQLNSNTIAVAKGNHKNGIFNYDCGESCSGWVQFNYQNHADKGVVGITYVLSSSIACDKSGNLTCSLQANFTTTPSPLSDFGNSVSLRGQSAKGLDIATVVIGQKAYALAIPGALPTFATQWKHAGFNVLGVEAGSKAIFNSETNLTLRLRMDNATSSFPVAAALTDNFAESALETNNLFANSWNDAGNNPFCTYGGSKPSAVFTQSAARRAQTKCQVLVHDKITPSAGVGGAMTPFLPLDVPTGAISTFRITPNKGYAIANVTGCNGVLSGDVFVTGPSGGNCTVTATFTQVAPATPTSAVANVAINDVKRSIK
jgi:hypothetical protein